MRLKSCLEEIRAEQEAAKEMPRYDAEPPESCCC